MSDYFMLRLEDWQARMRLLAASMLVNGLCWLGDAYRGFMHPETVGGEFSILVDSPSFAISIRWDMLSLFLIAWTLIQAAVILQLWRAGKLTRPM